MPRARSMPVSRSTSPISSPIASDARSPHAYISSSRARSRSAGGSVPRGASSSVADLVAREDLRQPAALLGRAQVDGRVVGDQVLAAQVAVEGAQAGDLALQRRRRDRRAVLSPGRQVGDEVGEVAVPGASARRRRSCAGARRTAAGPSGRPRACCATARARTPGRRGSRAAGARTAGSGAAIAMEELNSPPRRGRLPGATCLSAVGRGRPLHRRHAASATIRRSSTATCRRAEVSPPQGALLELLARLAGARAILEIGTLAGYSTLWLARALPPGGRLVTLEADPHHAEVARANLGGSPAEVIDGPALETLPDARPGRSTSIFIDADKRSNAEYLRVGAAPLPARHADRRRQRRSATAPSPTRRATTRAWSACARSSTRVAAEPRLRATAIQTVGVEGLRRVRARAGGG